MVSPIKKGQGESSDLDWLNEDDPLRFDEEIVTVLFKCIDCKKTDDVPEYIIGEFSVDLNKGEEVEIHCPYCNGTMIKARKSPK